MLKLASATISRILKKARLPTWEPRLFCERVASQSLPYTFFGKPELTKHYECCFLGMVPMMWSQSVLLTPKATSSWR